MNYLHTHPFYVYAHYKADTSEIFYIGKGFGNRLNYKYRKNKYWLNIVNKHGYVAKIISYFDNEYDAFNFETQLIMLYGRKDLGKGPLINLTNGGEGGKGRKGNGRIGTYHSVTTRNKIRGSQHPGKTLEERYGIQKAAEMKSKMIKTIFPIGHVSWNKGKKGNESHLYGKKKSPESIAKREETRRLRRLQTTINVSE